MSNDDKNLPMAQNELALALRRKMAAPVQSDGGTFLRFSKGDWMYGTEELEPEKEARFGVNPFGIKRGFIAWTPDGGGAPLGEEMRGLTEADLRVSDLPDVSPGKWVAQLGIEVIGLTGASSGLQMEFATSSRGGIKALQGLINAITEKAESGDSDFVPVIALETSSYQHKTYGRVKEPVLNITDWCTMDDTLDAYEEREQTEGTDEAPVVDTAAEVANEVAEAKAAKAAKAKAAREAKAAAATDSEAAPEESNRTATRRSFR